MFDLKLNNGGIGHLCDKECNKTVVQHSNVSIATANYRKRIAEK